MAKINKRTNELEDYIRQVEAKEKGKKKKLTILAFAFVGILGIGYIPFHLQKQKADLRTFPVDDLSIYAVDSIFEADTTRIVINNGANKKPDTISSVDEFIEMTLPETEPNLGISFEDDGIEADTTVSEATQVSEKTKITQPKTKLPKFFFAIEGSKIAGEKVNITIVDYDDNINYSLDFGNGVKKRIHKRLSYAYPKPGNFLINLIATNSTNASSIYTRSISIQPKPKKREKKADEPKTQIAEQPKTSVKEEASVDDNLVAANGQEADDLFEKIIENSSSSNNADAASRKVEKPAPAETNADEKREEMSTKITSPLVSAEKMPSFPGGEAAMYRFLGRKMRYPRLARESGTAGKVYLQFVVKPDGSLSNVKVLRGIGYGCDEEAIRVVGLMPKWIPGEQGGQKVPVYYTIRVTFQLQE